MSDNATAPAAAPAADTSAPANESANAPVVDYGEILAQHRGELARTGKTVESLRADLTKSHGTLDRMRKAFSDEPEKKISPYQARMKEFEELSTFLDTEAGPDLPITTRIGKKLADYGKQSEERAEKLEQELAELREEMKKTRNPALQGLERAAFAMEGMVDEALQQMYGAEPTSKGIRAAQFNAVTARINEEIRDLIQNDPESLLKVQRNPKIMRQMVNHFMAEMLPPKVRTMMDNERIQNEEQSPQELYQALAQARDHLQEAETAGDKRAVESYSSLMTEIRQQLLASQFGRRGNSKGSGSEKVTMNQLLGTVYRSVGGR